MTDITEPTDVEEPALVSIRTADIVVAALFLVVCAVVIKDSVRLGFNWRPNEGPAPGYFPFYVAIVMAVSSAINLARAILSKAEGEETLTTRMGVFRMAAIFVPALLYVFVTGYIGIYVASAVYIAAFMIFFGKFSVWKSLAVALSISGVAFLMFEVGFVVPLRKGPLEAAFGF